VLCDMSWIILGQSGASRCLYQSCPGNRGDRYLSTFVRIRALRETGEHMDIVHSSSVCFVGETARYS